jgi:hypothetical protein
MAGNSIPGVLTLLLESEVFRDFSLQPTAITHFLCEIDKTFRPSFSVSLLAVKRQFAISLHLLWSSIA